MNLPVVLNTAQPVFAKQALPPAAIPLFSNTKKNICIAPFAKHPEKMYPVEKTKQALTELLGQTHLQLFLLGGGKNEIAVLKEWEKEFPGIINLSGKFSFAEELAIISHMDMMISFFIRNTGCICLGCHTSLCRFLWMGTISGQCCTNRSVLPSLFSIWQ